MGVLHDGRIQAPPKFFPRSSTEIILHSALGLTVDAVNHENYHRVYMKLVLLINGLVDIGVLICSTLSITTNITELSSDTETVIYMHIVHIHAYYVYATNQQNYWSDLCLHMHE